MCVYYNILYSTIIVRIYIYIMYIYYKYIYIYTVIFVYNIHIHIHSHDPTALRIGAHEVLVKPREGAKIHSPA